MFPDTSSQAALEAPTLSVVLVAALGFDVIERTMAHLAQQSIASEIELLVMSPSPTHVVVPEAIEQRFFRLQILEAGPKRLLGEARAAGIRAAQAPFVALSEDHCFPEPLWAEMLVRQMRAGAVVAGPAILNANPETAISWGAMMIAYEQWMEPRAEREEAREAPFCPGHNSMYARDRLLELGDDLEALISSEVLIHWYFADRGERVVFEPRARCHHINLSSVRAIAHAMFHHCRLFGSERFRRNPSWKRWAYLLASPLIFPLRIKRSWRKFSCILPPSISQGHSRGTYAAALASATLGECLGLAFGAGDSRQREWAIELDRRRLLRPTDQPLTCGTSPHGQTKRLHAIRDRDINLGLIGCGRLMREVHLPNLQRLGGIRIRAFAEPGVAARTEMAALLPQAEVEDGAPALLNRKDIDAVIVATPPETHEQLAVAALEAGKHLYLEKPLAISLEEGQAVLAAEARASVVAMIGFNYRFHSSYHALRTMIVNGTLGKVVHVWSTFTIAAPPSHDWRQRSAAGGGGPLLDLFSHEADLIRYVLAEPLVKVQAQLDSRSGGGDVATVQAVTPSGISMQGLYAFGAAETATLTIIGELGQATVDRYGSLHVEHRPATPPGFVKRSLAGLHDLLQLPAYVRKGAAPWGQPSFTSAMQAFLTAIREGRAVHPSLADGYASLAAVTAAEIAAGIK